MKTIPVQTDNVTQLAATNFNPIPREIENAIKSQSIALDNSGANASQLAESISEAVSLNDLYQDSGSANVYTLSPIGQRKGLTQYIDGMTVRFEPAVNNSGASTVNVNSTGARKVYKNGVELSGGEITTGSSYSIEYDEVLDGGFGGFKLSKKITDSNISEYVSNENLLQNANFYQGSPDSAVFPVPPGGANYTAGEQVFLGWFVSAGGITGLSRDPATGLIDSATGTIYQDVPKSGPLGEYTGELSASWGNNAGHPTEDGDISFADAGDYYRVTLTPNGCFSAKMEQGVVASKHKALIAGDVKQFTFHTVAAAKAYGAPVGSKVIWRGYHAASDGGSNWGTIKSGAHVEDGGKIFTINATTYIEANLKGGRVSIMKFGAKDDLAHDSTVSIQNTLTYVAANKRNGFYIPAGNFLITEPLDGRAGGSGFGGKFSGEGYASALYYRPNELKENPVVPPFSDGDGIYNAGCINFGNDNTRGSSFKDFRIVMDQTKYNACGLFFYKWYQGHVKNVTVEGAEVGIFASFAWSGSIKKCNTLSCTNGIIVNNTTIFTFALNNIGACSTGITYGWNLYNDNVSEINSFTQGVTIRENTIQSCSEYAIYGKNTSNTTICWNYTEGNCAGPYPALEQLVTDSRFNGAEIVIDHADANPYGNSDLDINNNRFLSNQATTKRLLGLKNVLGFKFKSNNVYTTTKFFTGNVPVNIIVNGTVGGMETDASLVTYGTGSTQTPRDFAGVRSGAFASSMPQYTVAQLINTGTLTIPAGESRTVLMAYSLSSVADYSRISWTCNDPTGLGLTFAIGSYADNKSGTLLKQHTQTATVSVYDPGRTRITLSGINTVVLPSGIQYVFIEITNTAGVSRDVTWPTLTTNTTRGEFAGLLIGSAAPGLLLESAVTPIDPVQMTLLNY